MRILVKVGGAPLLDEAGRRQFARSVALAQAAGHEVLIVHGGGEQIRLLCGRLGIEDSYVDGLRVTDAATAEIVQAVLVGGVGGDLVHALQQEGVRAAGLCGTDGGSYSARPLSVRGQSLGFVGELTHIDPAFPLALSAMGCVPVMASLAPLAADAQGDASRLYNVNADHAAGPVAAALEVDALLMLSDVAAVRDAEGTPLEEITPEHHARLLESGALSGGMLPKLDAALAAAKARPEARILVSTAEREDCILRALAPGGGTRIHSGEAIHG